MLKYKIYVEPFKRDQLVRTNYIRLIRDSFVVTEVAWN